MLTAKTPEPVTMRCITVTFSTQTRTRRGLREREEKALTVIPCKRSSKAVVMTPTPEAKWPSAWRKAVSTGSDTRPCYTRNVRLVRSEIYEIFHSNRIRNPGHGPPRPPLWHRADLPGRAGRAGGPAPALPGADRGPAPPHGAGLQPDGGQRRLRPGPAPTGDHHGGHRA